MQPSTRPCSWSRRSRPRWVRETARSYGGEKADDSILVEIVSRIRQEAAFATLDLDDRHVAWGLGVVERGYVGLYDIVVAPDLRGIGLGRRIVTSLMAWGRDGGRALAPTCRSARTTRSRARSMSRSALSRPTATPTGSCRARRGVSVATSAPATMSAQASASERVASA